MTAVEAFLLYCSSKVNWLLKAPVVPCPVFHLGPRYGTLFSLSCYNFAASLSILETGADDFKLFGRLGLHHDEVSPNLNEPMFSS